MKAGRTLVAAVLCAAGFGGCASEVSEPTDQEWGLDAEGKFDSFFRPSEKGLLRQGASRVELADDANFLAYDFKLHGAANISIATAPAEYRPTEIDTVAYLYKQQADGRYGRYLAKDDNGGGAGWSMLELSELDAGSYRLLVKGRATAIRGKFSIRYACDGAGCFGPMNEESLLSVAGPAYLSSEGDESPSYIEAPFADTGRLTQAKLIEALSPAILAWYEPAGVDGISAETLAFDDYAADAGTRELLAELASYTDEDEDYVVESAKGWDRIQQLLDLNLTDLRSIKVGPRDEETGELAIDQGLYGRLVVGKTGDGRIAGLIVGDVET